MLSLTSLFVTLTSALAVSAAVLPDTSPAYHVVSLLRRQSTTFGGIAIPAVCEVGCASTSPIYDSCLANDVDGCLKVCAEGMLDEFFGCLNCLFVNEDAGSITASQYRTGVNQVNTIVTGCSARGFNFPPTVEIVGYDQLGSNYTSGSTPSATGTGATVTGTETVQAPAETSVAAGGNTGAGFKTRDVGSGALAVAFVSLATLLL